MKAVVWKVAPLMILTTALLFGCSLESQKKPIEETSNTFTEPQYEWGNIRDKTLVIWGDKSNLNRSYMQRSFERYEAMTGNHLEIVYLSKQELDEKVPKVFQQKSEERPDLLLYHGGTNLDNLNVEENCYDFTNAIWVDDLTDVAINQTIYNGKVLGLPHGEASISGMLYNKDLFQKYNIKIPTNQKEFQQACAIFLEEGITPVYLPYKELTMLLYQFPLDSIVQDTETLNDLNNESLSYLKMPSMKKIVQWYKDMSDNGYFGSNYIENDWNGMNGAMKSQKYAMMIAWDTWLYTDFDGDPLKFGLMPAFMGVPPQGSFEGPNIAMLMVNKNSEDLDAALDLITFMADPFNYNAAFKGIYTAPVFNKQIDSMSTPQYAEIEKLIESLFYDSTAALRIRGFSQYDAIYIQKYMTDDDYTLENCLRDMDKARIDRAHKKR